MASSAVGSSRVGGGPSKEHRRSMITIDAGDFVWSSSSGKRSAMVRLVADLIGLGRW